MDTDLWPFSHKVIFIYNINIILYKNILNIIYNINIICVCMNSNMNIMYEIQVNCISKLRTCKTALLTAFKGITWKWGMKNSFSSWDENKTEKLCQTIDVCSLKETKGNPEESTKTN